MDLLAVLVNGSVPVVEVAGWRARDRAGSFTPVGQIDHHTAAKASSSNPHPSLQTCVSGRAGIPGPLCNGLIDYHGRLFLICDGRANDSGMGSSKVLAEARRGIFPSGTAKARRLVDDTNGNPWFFDWEVEYDGVAQTPTAAQLETLIRTNVAVALAGFGVTIGHLEWTARKIDPANVSMSAIRGEIGRRIKALAAMAAGTGPSVAPDYSPVSSTVAHTTRCTLNGKVVYRMEVPIHLDSNGNGETGPDEGLHVPYSKVLAVSSHAPHSANYGGREGYKLAPAGHHEHNGELVVEVVSNNPALGGATVYPVVTVAD